MIEFWEYLNLRGEPVFSRWREGLPRTERATLDEKMRLIERMGFDVSCLKGPLRGYRHLYKIRIQGPTQALRPILCRGPFDMDREVTLLIGAREVGRQWQPPSAPDDADNRRREVAGDRTRRVRYQVPQP